MALAVGERRFDEAGLNVRGISNTRDAHRTKESPLSCAADDELLCADHRVYIIG